MKPVRLMNRIDTKFICNRQKLDELLEAAAEDYLVQENDGKLLMPYKTCYLDTPEAEMYRKHHCGKKNRYKIRIRTYEQSGISFLEVKHKDNHGRTTKVRRSWSENVPTKEADQFLESNSPYTFQTLVPTLENHFRRITLVNRELTERLTIDLELQATNPRTGRSVSFPDLVIIELKRDNHKPSIMPELLCSLRIRPAKFSKYCIGMALTDPDLKQNLFKERIRTVRKCTEILKS